MRNNNRHIRVTELALAASLLGAFVAGGVAYSAETSSNELNEIVVTANKRIENVNNVGSTVSVLGAEALKADRIYDLESIAAATPGLSFTKSAYGGLPVYTLRGVGFYDQSIGNAPDVSLYIDQFSLPMSIMATKSVFDLERVETLKGPQGTLFGDNATGGAINFIAAKPTRDFEAGMTTGYARFNTFDFEGYVSGPLSDNLLGRVAVRRESGDGWQESVSRGDSSTNGRKDNVALRIILDWTATDKLRFSLNVNGWVDQDDPQAARIVAVIPQATPGQVGFAGPVPASNPAFGLTVPPQNNDRLADWNTDYLRPKADDPFYQVALRTDYDLFKNITLTSLTSLDDVKYSKSVDFDGAPFADFQTVQTGFGRSFVQELRIANTDSSSLKWLVGANYEHSESGEIADAYSYQGLSAAVTGAGVSANILDQTMNNRAGFANLEFQLNNWAKLKAGVRQTRADRSASAEGTDPPTNTKPGGVPFTFDQFFNTLFTELYPGFGPPIQEGASWSLDNLLNANGTPLNPATYHKTGVFHGALDQGNTSWTVGVDLKPYDELLIYANVAKGYKSGSFPFLGAINWSVFEPVTQEELLSFETGFKFAPSSGLVSVFGSLFYYDYTNKQLLTKYIDPIFGAVDAITNVPKSAVKGAELEARLNPVSGLHIAGSVTYLDSYVTKYVAPIGQFANSEGLQEPILGSLAGQVLPNSPKWSYSLSSGYEFQMSGSLKEHVNARVTGQSTSYTQFALTDLEKNYFGIHGYGLLDLSAGIGSINDKWDVSVWGKNVANKAYDVSRFHAYDTNVALAGRPVEFGISLSMKF